MAVTFHQNGLLPADSSGLFPFADSTFDTSSLTPPSVSQLRSSESEATERAVEVSAFNEFLEGWRERQEIPPIQSEDRMGLFEFTHSLLRGFASLSSTITQRILTVEEVERLVTDSLNGQRADPRSQLIQRAEWIAQRTLSGYQEMLRDAQSLVGDPKRFTETVINEMAARRFDQIEPFVIQGKCSTKITPFAVFVYLDWSDYSRNPLVAANKSVDSISIATRLVDSELPPGLNGRLVLMNTGDELGKRTQVEIERTEFHESLHVLMENGYDVATFCTTPALLECLRRVHEVPGSQQNERVAELLLDSMMARAWSEVVSHGSTGCLETRYLSEAAVLPDYRTPACFGAWLWDAHLSGLSAFHEERFLGGANGIRERTEQTTEQTTEQSFMYPYRQAVQRYFQTLREYQWLAREVAREGSHTPSSIAALLLSLPPGEEAALSTVGLGCDWGDLKEQMETEFETHAHRFAEHGVQLVREHPFNVCFENLRMHDFVEVRTFPQLRHREAVEMLQQHVQNTPDQDLLRSHFMETSAQISLQS